MNAPLLIFERGCPNCGGSISDLRLKEGLVCEKCLKRPLKNKNILEALKKKNRLLKLKPIYECEKKLYEFEDFFKKATGFVLQNLQKTWAKRVFLKKSFAIVAPTGVGKTTFGLVLSCFFESKVLIIVPTKLLGRQAQNRLNEFLEKVNSKKRVLFYEPKEKIKKEFRDKEFDIFICTNAFLHKNVNKLLEIDFKFIFIDDVDSFLKRSKNIDSLFKLLGFTDYEIKLALKDKKTEDDLEKLKELRNRKEKLLILSSATLVPKTNRIKLFRNLLGFDIQKASSTLRNIDDFKLEVPDINSAKEVSLKIIKKLGSGGLIFISSLEGKKKAEELVEFYKKEGIKACFYEKLNLKDFEKGEYEVVVGLSLINNPLVRGIDLPSVIKYAIFLEPPLFKIPISEDITLKELFSLLCSLYNLIEEKEKVQSYIFFLKKYLGLREEALDKYPKIKERVDKIKEFLKNLFKDERFIEKIKNSKEVFLLKEENKFFIILGDAPTYIQATGRTSRLIGSKLTKGASFLLYTNPKFFNSLKKRLDTFFKAQEIEFIDFKEEVLDELKEELDKDREYAKKILEKKAPLVEFQLFKNTLVIVESPSKAKTIASFFGKPQIRIEGDLVFYEIPLTDRILSITACLGHVFDLVNSKGFFGILTENRFIPVYDTIKVSLKDKTQYVEIDHLKEEDKKNIKDKFQIVEDLRTSAFWADEVFICTDPDAEGEKIAYDIFLALRFFCPYVKRAEFHEVTPYSFKKALENSRDINLDLVKAQLVRRISDRWIGFALSQKLWSVFKNHSLSAGRVQTPVLGWIIENYNKLKEKKAIVEFEIADFKVNLEFEDTTLAKKVFDNLERAQIEIIDEKEELIYPEPPYTTDAILKDSPFSALYTMKVLQELFEKGLITYHRTDSTRVSILGQNVAKKFIEERFGKEFVENRSYFSEGAHECIRPTKPQDSENIRFSINMGVLELDNLQAGLKIYDMIFRRFISSQMKPAKVKYKILKIKLDFFEKEISVPFKILEEGFLKYNLSIKIVKREEFVIRPLKIRFVPSSPPFTQGSLIMRMKERGLGRPSTYAQIVNTLLERGYVVEKNKKLFPTKLGIKVYNFLSKNYSEYVEENFTKKLEEETDKVEKAQVSYQKILREAYKIKKII